MRVEYFHEGSEDCPLILIYGTELPCWQAFREGILKLLSGEIKELAVHALPGFESVEDCQLTAKLGASDVGIRRIGMGNTFEYLLTKTWWDNNEGLIEPFAKECKGNRFQFLDPGRGEIGLTISTFRGW